VNKLLPIVRREFPEFEAVQAFEAGVPMYFVRLALEVLEPQKLTSFQSYFLHAVALGVKKREELAHLLGVDSRDLLAPGASLLKLEYIEQGLPTPAGERFIALTPKGRQALSENPPPVPKRKTASLHFNALTWLPISREEETLSVDQMCKEGYFILPAKEEHYPTLGDFTEEEVTLALRGDPMFLENDVVALLELRKVELEYLAPVTVVLLQQRETSEQRLVVYRNGVQLRAESATVQRLFDTQSLHLPAEVASLKERGLNIPLSLPSDVVQVTQELVQNEYVVSNLEAELVVQETLHTEAQEEQEQSRLEARVLQLKEELRLKREDSDNLRQQLQQSQVKFLRTEEHRPFLEQALREAREEIIIISPWMNRRACNDYLCRLMGDAIARGVHIRIGYGMGKERDAGEAERNRTNVHNVKRTVERWIPKDARGQLDMRETGGTHQKILVCDRTFAITGSFNWLSYAGQQDEGYRNETGTLFYQETWVSQLAAIALQAFSS
jgi:hypothetical protein